MLGTLLLSTGVGFLFHSASLSESNIIPVYLLGVLLTAVWTRGYLYGAAASFLSVAAFNFFSQSRDFPFRADGPSYPVTFLIMLFSSILANSPGNPVCRSRRAWRRRKAIIPSCFWKAVKAAKRADRVGLYLRLTAEQLHRLFDRPVLYALSRTGAELSFRVEPSEAAPVPLSSARTRWGRSVGTAE